MKLNQMIMFPNGSHKSRNDKKKKNHFKISIIYR